jgi:hypothetical protein
MERNKRDRCIEYVMKPLAVVAALVLTACSNGGSPASTNASPKAVATRSASPSTTPVVAEVPPPGAQLVSAGCGGTAIYKGGTMPDWATVNAPSYLPYVVASPGLAIGYIFSYPLKAGLDANTKVLWYVATSRDGFPLQASGHPAGTTTPKAQFSSSANSFPGEIYPSGPTVPSAGCWNFSLTWHNGDEHAEVALSFQ